LAVIPSSGSKKRLMKALRIWITACAVATALVAVTSVAGDTKGLTVVHQIDGSVQTYRDVFLRDAGTTIWIRSADQRGILVISDGACSFVNEIQRCLPYAVTLKQQGESHQIPLSHGTVFMNLTATSRTLPLSSKVLVPREVLIFLKTERGTYVTVDGMLDRVTIK
jgi:hypothetical protein